MNKPSIWKHITSVFRSIIIVQILLRKHHLDVRTNRDAIRQIVMATTYTKLSNKRIIETILYQYNLIPKRIAARTA